MHVAVSGWLLGTHSGANRRLCELLRHAAPLLADGERITLLHREGEPPRDLPDRIALRAIAIPGAPSWRRAACEWLRLGGALRELRATVCDHGFLPAPRVPCALALTVHDVRDADGFGTRSPLLARLALRRAAARAATIVVPSEFTERRVLAFAPRAKTVVVPNGADLVDPAALTTAKVVASRLVHVGHLEPRKNLEVLVRALALADRERRHELWLVGADAGSGASLRALAHSLGVADRVVFTGPVADDALQDIYASAGAIVVPSSYEGFGLAALEGLAHGRPTLVADRGALPEVTGNAGIVLPSDDARAWAHAFATIDDSEPARLARRRRAAEFSWQRAARAMLDVWRSLS